MRKALHIILVMMLAFPALARDSESQAKSKFRNWLKSMAQIEARVKPVQPMHIALAKRTREEDREMTQRIEFLDAIYSKDVPALAKEISNYRDCPDSLGLGFQAIRDANEALRRWAGIKLELQNAGVNNPGLESLRKNEPLRYAEYRKAYEAAGTATK